MFQTERPSTMKVSEELTGEIHCLFYCAAHGSARHSWQRSKKVTRRSFSLGHAYAASGSGVASPKFLGSKSLTLREQRYNCLGRRFSKHKMTRYAKNLGGHGLLTPWVRPWRPVLVAMLIAGMVDRTFAQGPGKLL